MIVNENSKQARRKAAMAVLAHADAAEIARHLAAVASPPYENLREAENGLVMVRGRVGGDGAPFNLGEATVSRAAVRLAGGEVGFGYTLGRDREKAHMIALHIKIFFHAFGAREGGWIKKNQFILATLRLCFRC